MNEFSLSRRRAIAFVTLRVAIGAFLVFKGLDKLSWIVDAAPLSAKLGTWLQHAGPANRWYLEMVLPGAPVFARLSACGELLGGAALICGFATRRIALLAGLAALALAGASRVEAAATLPSAAELA
jgi:uncharacterized membrane protein YphA (DoxX/SURF4 family)